MAVLKADLVGLVVLGGPSYESGKHNQYQAVDLFCLVWKAGCVILMRIITTLIKRLCRASFLLCYKFSAKTRC